MTARKSCKCPGCGKLTRVTRDGRIWNHSRSTTMVTSMHAPIILGMRRCEWGGKPAPTEPEHNDAGLTTPDPQVYNDISPG